MCEVDREKKELKSKINKLPKFLEFILLLSLFIWTLSKVIEYSHCFWSTVWSFTKISFVSCASSRIKFLSIKNYLSGISVSRFFKEFDITLLYGIIVKCDDTLQ